MTRRMLLLGLVCISGLVFANGIDLDGPPANNFRGTWTETREDMPDTILVHRNGHVMEVMRVPGTGEAGIPLQLIGPSEISVKWLVPVPWPPSINVLAEEPQYGDVIRIQVAGDATLAAAELMAMPEVLFAYPVEYTEPMFARIMPTDQIIARLAADVTIDQVEGPFGLMMVEPMLGSTVEYVLQMMDPKAMAPDLVVSNLVSSGLVEWAQVNCIRDAEFYPVLPPYVPTDPQFGNQWHLNATGQAIGALTAPVDVDVDATDAWSTTLGNPSIRVAVIDDAIETNHVDLAANIYQPGAWDFYSNDSDPSPDNITNDIHGTACAGVVGAVEGNGIGVVGMAPQSPIVPIKICSNGILPNDAQVANSVRHGAQHADIITCSWGYVNPAPSTLSAVQYALQSGAGGRGSIVFFAAGNDGGFIPHKVTLASAGSYNLRWRYTKDGSISSGLDRCFVDTVWYPDGTQEMFDGLTLPNLPAGMTSGGVGAWNSLAQSAGSRAESGIQFIGSSTAVSHSQSTYAQITKNSPAPNTPMWYYMRVDAQPTTYVGNNATVYDFGQIEYQLGAGGWTTANVQGGSPQTLSYPANDPETIAVGASDITGRRSHYSQWAGGTALDFVAPSDGSWATLGIETTDVTGPTGYSSGSYCLAAYGSKFGGTSSATPLAAGIGALVRSVNSSLSPSQVRNILRSSCKKIDPTWYTYTGILGGRDQHVGWGQVNASNAVLIAQMTQPIPVMANDLKITEVSPQDMNAPFVEIYNSSAFNGYQLDTVMLTDCATGGDQSESSYQFPMGSMIPPQGTIVVALGISTPMLITELQALVGAGAASPGGLQLFECMPSGSTFMGGPIGLLTSPPPLVGTGINLTPSDNIALVITPGMPASYLPDLIDGMSYGMPLVNGVLGAGPMMPDAAPLMAGGATPTASYQRTGLADTNVSQADFSVQSRTPGWVAFGAPVTSFVAAPLTSYAIDLRVTPFVPGDTVMIAQSIDSGFDYPVHGMAYPPMNPLGPGGDMVVYNGPADVGIPIIDMPLPSSVPFFYRVWTVDPMMQYSVGKDSDSSALPAPIPLPFSDDFALPTLDAALWPYAPGVSVDLGLLTMPPLPSPPHCAQMDYSVSSAPELATTGIDTTTTPNVKLTYFWQEGGGGDPPEPGEILRVEILEPGLTWMPVMEHIAIGLPLPFQPQEVFIEPGMLHDEFRVRFVSVGVSSGPADLDIWFIDDVKIEEYPVLSGFQWDPIPAKVSAGVPFTAQVTALSSMGGTLSNYMDDATLTLFELPLPGTPLATLDPTIALPFIDGVWSNDAVLISGGTDPVHLTAEFSGIIGTSTVFEVREDVDEDGMTDSWEFQHFGDIGVATNTPGSDQDSDKYPDYSEFIAGTIPTDSNSLLDVTVSLSVSNNIVSWPSVSNRTYTVDGASNLLSGFSVLTNNIISTPPTNTYIGDGHSNAPMSFYRIKVTK